VVRTGTTLQNILVHYTYGLLGQGVVQLIFISTVVTSSGTTFFVLAVTHEV